MQIPNLPARVSRNDAPATLPPPTRGEAFDQYLVQSRAAAADPAQRAARGAQLRKYTPPEPARNSGRPDSREPKPNIGRSKRASGSGETRGSERIERDNRPSEREAATEVDEAAETEIEESPESKGGADEPQDESNKEDAGSDAIVCDPRVAPRQPTAMSDEGNATSEVVAVDADVTEAAAASGTAAAVSGFEGESDTPDATTVAAPVNADKSSAGKSDAGADLLKLLQPVGADSAARPRGEAQSAPSGNAAPAAPTPAAEQDPNVARVARGLQNAVNQKGGSVTLRLTPAELGVVRIQMEVRDGVASVRLQAEQESVRTLLNHQLNGLRHALESQGLTVDRLDVQITPATNGGSAGQQSGLGQERQADGPPSDGRSRGQFERRDEERNRRGREEQTVSFESLVNEVA
jgi:flagellar hook-length control protein FliK